MIKTRRQQLLGVIAAASLGGVVVAFAAITAIAGRAQTTASTGSVKAGSCEGLQSISLPNTTISLAQAVPAGGFKPPDGSIPAGRGGATPPGGGFSDLPAFCRVAGTIKPHPTSNIKFEVWLPTGSSNQKLVQVGNGGFAGTIQYAAMATRLREGYATASTDDGTSPSSDKSFLADLDRIADFKGGAVVETALKAKALFKQFYGAQPKYSYFTGGSTGGLEALAVVQRIPDQFNGVTAGCPAFNSAGLFTQGLWTYKYYQKIATKIDLIHKEVMAECDAVDDGISDGVINNPEKCHFDPGSLLCASGDQPNCLTAEQVDAVRKIYQGPVNPATGTKTGEEYAPGMVPGSELIWSDSKGAATGTGQPWYGEVLHGTPTIDMDKFDFGSDVARALALTKPHGAQVTDSDISKFRDSGAKLIMYAGWNDPLWSEAAIVGYYKQVVSRQLSKNASGQKADDEALGKTKEFARLFMAPGMGHCGGGNGPNVFDYFGAIVKWVEHGEAPDSMIATKYVDNKPSEGVERTRPLCPYPSVSKWKGAGNTNNAENFVCAAPPL